MSTSAQKPLALVTGASTGIGLELARQFAQGGFDLVVCANEPAIQSAAQELRQDGTQVHTVQADLATEQGNAELWRQTQQLGRPLAAAALNAGVGQGGAFADNDLHDELRIIDLNVRGTVQLAKYVVQEMASRGEGRILFTSSIASTMPGAYQAIYNASKSFVQSFALALREELSDTGVTVTSLMPGPTDTEFFARGDLQDTRLAASATDDPAEVARDGYEALMAGKERVVSESLMTKVQARTSRLVPDSVKAALHGKLGEPGSAEPPSES